MSPSLYRFRAELRRGGWRFVVGSALLLGIVGGSALLAAGGGAPFGQRVRAARA